MLRVAGRERADVLLERVGLTDAADRRVGTYSGGMRRRLDLASALVHSPPVLFLDEPTTGLDPVSRMAIWKEVRALNDEGTTVFLTTQYLEEADVLANRVGIINRGKIVIEGTPSVLKAGIRDPHLEICLADGDQAAAREVVKGHGTLQPDRDGVITLSVSSGAAAIAPVVRSLDDAGIKVESLRLVEPTLDDVFVAHTGEHLDEESPTGEEPIEAAPG
jgi:ABC-2 type transport system ATP-binding protein